MGWAEDGRALGCGEVALCVQRLQNGMESLSRRAFSDNNNLGPQRYEKLTSIYITVAQLHHPFLKFQSYHFSV